MPAQPGAGPPGAADVPEYRPPGPGARLDPDGVVAASPAVADGTAPVLRVRVTDSGWQFLAGLPDPAEGLVPVVRRELYRRERGIAVLEEFLPVGYGAVREGAQEPWGIGPLVLQDVPPQPEPTPAERAPGGAPDPTDDGTPPVPTGRGTPPARRPWWRRLSGR